MGLAKEKGHNSVMNGNLLTFCKQGREEIRFAVYKGLNPMARSMHLRKWTAFEV